MPDTKSSPRYDHDYFQYSFLSDDIHPTYFTRVVVVAAEMVLAESVVEVTVTPTLCVSLIATPDEGVTSSRKVTCPSAGMVGVLQGSVALVTRRVISAPAGLKKLMIHPVFVAGALCTV